MRARKENIKTLKIAIESLQKQVDKLENEIPAPKQASSPLFRRQAEERRFFMQNYGQEDLERLEVEHKKEQQEEENPAYEKYTHNALS